MKLSYTLLLSLFFATSLIAQDTKEPPTLDYSIITDRPDQTESASVIPVNFFQLESGTAVETVSGESNWSIMNHLFRYGVAKNLELRLISEVNRFSFSDISGNRNHAVGISDFQMGLKYGFVDKDVQLAYLGHIVFPSGTGNNSEEISFNSFLCFSHGLGERASVGYNLGMEFTNEDNYALLATVVIGFSLTDKLGFFTEIYANAPQFEDFEFNYDNGFTYLLKPNIQLDFSYGTGLTNKFNFYSAGVSWRIPN